MSLVDFVPFVPEIFLAVAAFIVLLAGIPLGRRGSRPVVTIAIAALAVTAVLIFLVGRPAAGPQLILGDMLVVDQFAVFFKLLVLAASALALLMAGGFIDRSGYSAGEFASLVREYHVVKSEFRVFFFHAVVHLAPRGLVQEELVVGTDGLRRQRYF